MEFAGKLNKTDKFWQIWSWLWVLVIAVARTVERSHLDGNFLYSNRHRARLSISCRAQMNAQSYSPSALTWYGWTTCIVRYALHSRGLMDGRAAYIYLQSLLLT
jgi:hypothetical protein